MKIRNTKTGANYSSDSLVKYDSLDFNDNYFFDEKNQLIFCFSDGWKEDNGNEWHDLTKNPNDLPPYNQRVIVTDGLKTCTTFRKNNNSVKVSNDFLYKFALGPYDGIIAWMEFPQFIM